MISKELLSQISGVLVLSAFVPLIISVMKGYRPPKSSWIIWAVVDGVILVGMWQKHTLNGQIIGVNVGVWLALIAIFKFGTPGWTRGQIFQIVLAILGIVMWQMKSEANIGILIGSGVLLLGAWETWKDAWVNPDGQKSFLGRLSWILFELSCIPACLSVQEWNIEYAAQPVAFLVIETVMLTIIFGRPAWLEFKAVSGW